MLKKFLFWIFLPSVGLGIVSIAAYNAGRSDGVRTSAVPAPIHAAPSSVPPAAIAPELVEPTAQMVTKFRQTPDGPVVTSREVLPLPKPKSVTKTPKVSEPVQEVKRFRVMPDGSTERIPPSEMSSSKAVFRTPERAIAIPQDGSGKASVIPVSAQMTELQPLHVAPIPDTPVIAKPDAAPTDKDCGCNKK